MTTVSTIHENDETIRVVENGAVEYRFAVDDTGDHPTHEYLGDDEPPANIVEALESWVAEYHDIDGENT